MTYFADYDIHFDDDMLTADGLTYEQYVKLPVQTRLDRLCPEFVGFGVPCEKSTADGGTITSEKILKFDRAAARELAEQERKAREKAEKENRFARLVAHYQNDYNVENEISPFED